MRCSCSTSSTTTLHWCCDSSMGRVNIARKGLLHAAAGISYVHKEEQGWMRRVKVGSSRIALKVRIIWSVFTGPKRDRCISI